MTRAGEPIKAAYFETGALWRDCPLCGAPAETWCSDEHGRIRRVPCVLRTVDPTRSNAGPSAARTPVNASVHGYTDSPAAHSEAVAGRSGPSGWRDPAEPLHPRGDDE